MLNQTESLYITDLETVLQEILDAVSMDALEGREDPLLLAASRLLERGLEPYEPSFEGDAD